MEHKHILLIVAAAISITALVLYFAFRPITAHSEITYDGGSLTVLVADSMLERARGLSGTQVETLGADGMLFTFPQSSPQTFWMNQMNYALDVLWLQDGVIVAISTDVPPPTADDPAIARMSSGGLPVNQVLELPAGQVAARGLKVGDRLTID